MTLISIPRRGLPWIQNAIFFSLTAMEMAWYTPLVMIFWPSTWRSSALLHLLGLWGVMLGMILIAHFLERLDIPTPTFEAIVAGILIAIGLIAIRILVFADEPISSLNWLKRLLEPGNKRLQIGVILGTLAFLWWRAVTFLQRPINFFVIGYDFRKGVLALLFTTSIFRHLSHQSAMMFVHIFFFFGLLAVALGRAEEKASTTGGGRAPIQRSWLGVASISITAVLGVAWLFGHIWSLEGFRRFWQWLTPPLSWIAPYAEIAILFFLRLLNPFLEWFVHLAQGIIGGESGEELINNLSERLPSVDKVMGYDQTIYTSPGWLEILFRYVIPITVAMLVLLMLVFWLVKRRHAQHIHLIDEEHMRVKSLEGPGVIDALRRGFDKLGELMELIGQFGVGRKFYAAVSIRHIYANVQKLASQQGYPRDPSWTPNDYLPQLIQAFPEQEHALQHITEAYNAYEYGHVAADPAELKQLKAAWERIRKTSAPQPHRDRTSQIPPDMIQ